MITVHRKIEFSRRPDRTQRLRVVDTEAPRPALPAGRVPRITRLMALAIHLEGLLREGVVRDQSELARRAQVTQPRMTQILALNLLAPDIQAALLNLPRTERGRDPINEPMLRPIRAEMDWTVQRAMWRRLLIDINVPFDTNR